MALGVNFGSFYVVVTVNIYAETKTFSFFLCDPDVISHLTLGQKYLLK